ncbi:histidine kinase [Streptomyces sp. NBC_01351]|uniref:sensor histidine kinase n=1 Tax=Streptomyces sp. NBC_01351 TaxID=2903833 RepID=UPI002E3099C4|nr:histidine kinase [Streptomyces sp. NBC_01351]
MSKRRPLLGWWDRRSDPARIELYTRWTFHFLAFNEVLLGAESALSEAPGAPIPWLAGLITLHAVAVGATCSRALDWALDRRARPGRLLALTHGLTVIGTLAVIGAHLTGRLGPGEGSAALIAIVPSFGILAATVNPRSPSRVCLMMCLAFLTAGAGVYAATASASEAFQCAWVVLFGCAAAMLTARFSTWMLTVVWELDRARSAQVRLAVTEERLRFARDLHDIMGRNLSVIALKSELASQLARRDAVPRAVEQMDEVQRMARDSQQEVREVVRGYRKVGLQGELLGAFAVLRAGGIDCSIETAVCDQLPPAVQSVFGWVVREGGTNILRHSAATRASIELRITDDGRNARLSLTNDGARPGPGRADGADGADRSDGPDGADGAGSGSGLAGLRERLASLGGSLHAEHGPDGTFLLEAEVPLNGPKEPADLRSSRAPGPGERPGSDCSHPVLS